MVAGGGGGAGGDGGGNAQLLPCPGCQPTAISGGGGGGYTGGGGSGGIVELHLRELRLQPGQLARRGRR